MAEDYLFLSYTSGTNILRSTSIAMIIAIRIVVTIQQMHSESFLEHLCKREREEGGITLVVHAYM